MNSLISFKPPIFKGEGGEVLNTWIMRFRAYAQEKNFVQALLPSFDSRLPASETTVLDENVSAEKLQMNALEMNGKAMRALIHALEQPRDNRKVSAEMRRDPTNWPNGKAWKVWDAIMRHYLPSDVTSEAEMEMALAKITLKKKENPVKILDDIATVECRFNKNVTEDKRRALVQMIGGKEYSLVICSTNLMYKTTQQRNATAEELCEEMRITWRMSGNDDESTKGKTDENELETALVTFKGKCNKCHMIGHKAANCPQNKKGTTQAKSSEKAGAAVESKSDKKCTHCSKPGHVEANCWKKHPEKTPEWAKGLKGKSGEAGTATLQELLLAAVETPLSGLHDGFLACETMDMLETESVEFGLGGIEFPANAQLLSSPNVWIGDTGASGHSTGYDIGGTNVRDGVSATTGMNGAPVVAAKEMDIPVEHCDKTGQKLKRMIFKDVSYLKGANFNLCSLTKMMIEGWTMVGDSEEGIYMRNDSDEVRFDIVIKTEKGAIMAGYFKRTAEEHTAVAAVAHDQVHIKVKRLHQMLGHFGERDTRMTGKYLGYEIARGVLQPCESCALAKARQRNVPKVGTGEKATEPNGRWFMDQSQLKPPKGIQGTKTTWSIIVDEYSNCGMSGFYDTKDAMIEPFCRRLQQQVARGKPVKILRMDNAGENKALEKSMSSSEWKFGTKIEYTARGTPQQNSMAEQKFASLARRTRALLNDANVPRKYRWLLFPEAAKTATELDWLLAKEIGGVVKARIEHFGYPLPRFTKHLRTWGEAGTVKLIKVNKVDNYGATCVFIGYASNHEGICYRMWNPLKRSIHETRDVVWLHRMYFEVPNTLGEKLEPVVHLEEFVPDPVNEYVIEDNSDAETVDDTDPEEKEGVTEMVSSESDAETDGFAPDVRRSNRARKTKGVYEPETGKTVTWNIGAVNNYYDALREIVDDDDLENVFENHIRYSEYGNVGAALGGGFENTKELRPMKYDEAISGPDGEAWKIEIDNEHNRMVKNEVWDAVRKADLPAGVKPIDSTWACKKKSSGKLRGRLNARGFKQVDGVHFDGSSIHSPVTNAATIRIVLVLMLMAAWTGHLTDVNGAFLLGKFTDGEEIYMKVPQGFEKFYASDVLLKLKKTLYGLKQAAMAFWRELLKAMRSMGFTRSTADPCLYFKWTQDGLAIMASWIDDNLIVGNEKVVLATKNDLMSRFECEDCGEITEYVGCKIVRVGSKLKFTQPVLLQSFSDEFEMPSRKYNTPASAGTVLIPGTEAERLSAKEATKYRSGVGKLMHMMQYSRPEIYNAVRDCSRHMKEPTQVHFDAMIRIMKYCVDTPERGLTIEPNGKWDGSRQYQFVISGKSDSDYAKCPTTRKSISGFRVFLDDAPVIFKSATQKRAATSVCEAELYAGYAAAQEMLYAKHVVESLGLKVKLPMVLEMDNKGAVDHSNSWSVGGHMRHVGTKQVFLRELKEEGILIIKWVSTDENEADLFTKNLDGPLFAKFAKAFVGDDEYNKKV